MDSAKPNGVLHDDAQADADKDMPNVVKHAAPDAAADKPQQADLSPTGLMKLAIEEGCTGVANGEGGPFGAVIARGDEIISRGHNRVLQTNDPTAHAEIVAIRDASARLGRFSLDDCVLYSSCEPCPMCLSAIHWAKIPRVYFAATAADAAAVGFDDAFLYDMFKGKPVEQKCQVSRMQLDEYLRPFRLYSAALADNRSGRY